MKRFPFKGLFGCESVCGVEIIDRPQNCLVIVTEIPENPGTSVTNGWPSLADQIFYKELLSVSKPIVWIEHYPERHIATETFDYVFMDWTGKGYRMVQNKHPWKRLSLAEVQELLISRS